MMVKRLFYFAALIIPSAFISQSYNKMIVQDTTTWQHFGFFQGFKSPVNTINITNNSIAALDTISIFGNTYKKLYHLETPSTLNYANKSLLGYIREDTLARKVYFKDNIAGPDYLLYDFSLSLGDSVLLSFPTYTNISGYYRVDSIVTKNELCGPRKHFYVRKHLNNNSPSTVYYDWIESIGSNHHLLYIYGSSPWGTPSTLSNSCKIEWLWGLACKSNDLDLQFRSCTSLYPNAWGNTYINQCTYYYFSSGLSQSSSFNHINLYPNPSKGNFIFEFSSEKDLLVNFKITDLSGKLIKEIKDQRVKEGANRVEIKTEGIEAGAYSLLVESPETKGKVLILIQN